MDKKYILLLFFFCLSIVTNAQKMTTLTYYEANGVKLELDLFLPEKPAPGKLPLVIYAHGGGFSGGERTAGHDVCKFLAKEGVAAATITYTLYMKDKNFSCDGIVSEKIKAIQLAVNDMWQATAFFTANSDKYNIDPSKIFIAGTSAGAEMAFHAAYWDYKKMNLRERKLPENFKYAGMITGSGAIMDLNLIRKDNLIPMMLFHGSGDKTVPYGTASHHYCPTNSSGWLMLFGSYSVYEYVEHLDGTVRLFTFCNGGHNYSHEYFGKDQKNVCEFVKDVLAGKKFRQHTIIPTNQKSDTGAVYSFCN